MILSSYITKLIIMKTIIKILLISLFFSLIALGLISCGARKIEKSIVKEEVKSEVSDKSTTEKQFESNIKENIVVKIDDKNKTIIEETTYEPKDPTKEAIVIEPDGSKTILNNSKKITKKTTKQNDTKSEIKYDSEIKQKEAVKDKKAIKASSNTDVVKKASKTEREAVSMWNWLWLLIPIGIVVWLLRKYTDKIWWV